MSEPSGVRTRSQHRREAEEEHADPEMTTSAAEQFEGERQPSPGANDETRDEHQSQSQAPGAEAPTIRSEEDKLQTLAQLLMNMNQKMDQQAQKMDQKMDQQAQKMNQKMDQQHQKMDQKMDQQAQTQAQQAQAQAQALNQKLDQQAKALDMKLDQQFSRLDQEISQLSQQTG